MKVAVGVKQVVQLELDGAETILLIEILRHISGVPNGPRRIVDGWLDALREEDAPENDSVYQVSAGIVVGP